MVLFFLKCLFVLFDMIESYLEHDMDKNFAVSPRLQLLYGIRIFRYILLLQWLLVQLGVMITCTLLEFDRTVKDVHVTFRACRESSHCLISNNFCYSVLLKKRIKETRKFINNIILTQSVRADDGWPEIALAPVADRPPVVAIVLFF